MNKKEKAYKREILLFIRNLLILAIIGVLVLKVFFGITYARNDDMAPRVSAKDIVFYYRMDNDIINNEVVVIEKNGETYIGRVVARGGDQVEVLAEGGLLVNGNQILDSSIYYETRAYDNEIEYPITLEQDEYFVLGDKRDGAVDSRAYGPVARDELKGTLLLLLRRSSF